MKIKKYNVIDIETEGLDIDDKINFIGILTYDNEEDPGEYIILQPGIDNLDILDNLKDTINIFHNGKFDTKMMKYHINKTIPITHDTMLLAYLCSTAPELIDNRGKWLSLKACAMRLLGVDNWDVELSKKTSAQKENVEEYLKKDLLYTRKIYDVLKSLLDEREIATYKLMLKATEVYTQVELNGLPINLEQLEDVTEEFVECLMDIDLQLQAYANINWNSPKQLQDLLYTTLKLPIPMYTNTGQPGTGIEALTKLKGSHPIVDLILKRREYDKALTFLKDWKERAKNGRLYANFNLHTTVTGRTSCNGPNLQQIPRNKKLKTLFQSTDPDWELVQLDYSQMELRTAAIVAGVKAMKDAYTKGEDLHTNMAALVAGKPKEEVTKPERTRAKAANFGYLYGMQPATFVQYAKIGYGVDMSLEEATRIRNSFFEANYELHKYYKDTQDALLSKGYVTSIMGRRYKVGFKHLAFPDNRQLYMRKILNFPVQSAASDWALCALYEIYKTFSQDEVKICATVHDSIIMEIRKNENFAENITRIQSIMQAPQLAKKYITKEVDLPIVADIEVGPWGIGVGLEEYMEGTHE
jgi:DNA polymerase I-like protein with 3'-5' exonuclease and polymerase domains